MQPILFVRNSPGLARGRDLRKLLDVAGSVEALVGREYERRRVVG
jgi:hypothetical protein